MSDKGVHRTSLATPGLLVNWLVIAEQGREERGRSAG